MPTASTISLKSKGDPENCFQTRTAYERIKSNDLFSIKRTSQVICDVPLARTESRLSNHFQVVDLNKMRFK